ncbi:MAG: hypothetical protein GC192_22690 [Bacteroidetes bacterium]|nr:hypothetical protein [Bacteroidota bacterium]
MKTMRPLTPKLVMLLLSIGIFLFTLKSYAQTSPCGSDQIHDQLKAIDPLFAQRMAEAPAKFQAFLEQKSAAKNGTEKSVTTTYTIPLVFHVIYTSTNASNNISDAQIQSAVQRLNEIYSNGTGTTVDTKIQFQLATMDENCAATTGIVRVSGAGVTNYTNHGIDGEVIDSDGIGASMSSIFNLSRWDPDLYLNIYVVSEINNNDGGYGTQAYAFYPSASDSYYGVVIMYNTLGYDYNNCGCYQLKSYSDENETLAHEVGHALYLKHTFEGGTSSACPSTDDTAGDEVADTPAHKYITYCPTSGGNSCYSSSDPFYSWDKIKYNLMGYFTETCTNQFTQGQADRMAWAIETYKPGLLYSTGLQSTAVTMTAASCTPQTTSGLGGEYGVGPIKVTIGDMVASSNSAYQDGGYLSRSCFSASLEINQTYPVEIITWGNYSEDVQVYIDWDNDGSMTASELIFSGENAKAFSGTFTVPSTATTGQWLRARVISDHKQYTISSSCYAPVYGQVEDYPVYVASLNPTLTCSVTSLSTFTTQTTTASASQSFKITGTDLSGNVTVSNSNSAFELSSNGTSYSASLSFTPSNSILSEKTVYVRLKSNQAVGTYSGTITISASGASSKTVSITGKVGEISSERGNAMEFDGDGDGVSTDFNGISGGQSRSFEAWVKTPGEGIIFGYGINSTYKKWVVRTDANGYLRIEINNAYKVGTTALTDGEWHHIAVVLDNSSGATLANTTLYVDGKVESISSSNNTNQTINTDASGSLTIGRDMSSRYFEGLIDEVRIWSVARSAQEIRENMHLTLTGSESGLAAYYQFNSAGSTTYDWVGFTEGSLEGDASFAASSINCGREGTSQSISGIASTGLKTFSDSNFKIDFSQKNGSDDFTVTYQEFEPNGTTGTDGNTIFQNPVWTVNRSGSSSFLADFTFSLPANTLTETDPYNFALYHRSMGGDGDWELLSATGSSVSGSAVTFDNISETGQFMLAQTGTSTERGQAIQLDGVDDELQSNLNFDPASQPFTVEFWVKLEGDSAIAQIILDKLRSDGNSYFTLITLQSRLWAYFGGQLLETQSPTVLSRSEWNHIAFVWDLQTAKLYLNGLVVAASDISSVPSNTANLNIGTLRNQGYHFNGKLDEIRYWATARSQQEILEGMHLSAAAKLSSSVFYYQMNRTSSDLSGGQVLSLIGNPVFTSSGANVGGDGDAQTITNMTSQSSYEFENTKIVLDLTTPEDSIAMTTVYQAFTPNTTDGISGSTIFDGQNWTLHETTGNDFSADITFGFPAGTFTDFVASSYKLYSRTAGSDGAWALLVDGAAAVNESSIKFNAISTVGQFIVVKN